MKVLVLYYNCVLEGKYELRNTIREHLYSFRHYCPDTDFHYYNALSGIPAYLAAVKYDGIILHYTLLAVRWQPEFFEMYCRWLRRLARLPGYVVAIPQDEYAESTTLCRFFRMFGVKAVFTCLSPRDYQAVYPREETGLTHYFTVFPGYVDERAKRYLDARRAAAENREIDIGYRARKVPYWLGRHGQMKHELGERVAVACRDTELRTDISNQIEDVFLEHEWYDFLCRCRTVLGCEGGASLLDRSDTVRPLVTAYCDSHPDASFDEVERQFFPGQDYNIHLFALSPRHFECAVTKTCQVLIEGNYGGVFKPGQHYIEVKKDYSNLPDVIAKIGDHELCRHLAETAYRDIAESAKYTYRAFAEKVLDHIRTQSAAAGSGTPVNNVVFQTVGYWLAVRERFEPAVARLFVLNLRYGIRALCTFILEPGKKERIRRMIARWTRAGGR